jgi:hypothetical protein
MSELADLLERFRRGAELLAVVTTGAAGSELDFKPGEGKWSVREITCHLADSEAVAGTWFRQLVAEENPTLTSFDQNAWTAKLGYERRKISQAIEMFRLLRFGNYELLKDQAEDVFQRGGTHTGLGQVNLLQCLRGFAEHAEGHVKQIQGVRASFKEHRAKQAAK